MNGGIVAPHTTVTVANQLSTTLTGSANGQILVGTSGIDMFDVVGHGYNDILISGGGADTVKFSGLASDHTFTVDTSVNGVTATVLTVASVADGSNILSGFSGDTIMFGATSYNLVYGDGATVTGTAADNILVGGSSANTFTGGAGNDLIYGGGGIDTAAYSGTFANHTIVLTATGATVAGTGASLSDGTDTLTSIERLTFAGSAIAAQNNVLIGTTGNDTILSQTAPQWMIGGAGDDTFVFASTSVLGNTVAGRDVIADFVHGHDKIDLSGIDANGGQPGTPAFLFDGQVGTTDLTGIHARGHVGFHHQNISGQDHTIVEGTTNTAVDHSFQIDLIGNILLDSGDFNL